MHEKEKEFSFYNLFIPLTVKKVIVFLILISSFLFFFGFFNNFVGDDNTQILDNPAIRSIQNIPRFLFENRLTTGTNNALGAYYFRPLIDIYLTLVYALAGPNPVAFHFFQIVLYVANAIIVFLLFKKLFGLSVAFLLALLFLVHPINDEEIFYISATQDVLFFFFGILSLWLLNNYKSQKAFVLSILFIFLSILSKETGILFLVTGFLYVLLFRKKLILPFVWLSALGVLIYGALRIHAVGILSSSPVINAPIQKLTLAARLINIPSVFLFYIKTVIFPYALSSSWQWIVSSPGFENFFLPLFIDILFLGVVGVGAIAIHKKKLQKQLLFYLFFCSWFLVGIAFHLQILPLDQTVAERWFYFPFVGLLGMIGVNLTAFKINLMNRWVVAALIFIIVIFSVRIFVRGMDYKNDLVLSLHDIRITPDSYNLNYILGHIYYVEGDLKKSKQYSLSSIRLFPYITNYTNLGATYSRMGDYKNARKAYMKAIKYGSDSLPYENLAALSLAYGQSSENIDFIKNTGLKKYPKDGMMWYTLAILEYTKGDKVSALHDISQAKLYFKNTNVDFIYSVIKSDKNLKYKIQNGGIQFFIN